MSKWTHSICAVCWDNHNPRNPYPHTINKQFRDLETCCFCGEHTRDGIYIRANPETTPFCQHDKQEVT